MRSVRSRQCCFITAGATGVAGKPGATGDTGDVHAAQHAPTTPPLCDGPMGKDV